MAQHRIRIGGGTARFVYSDELVPLAGRLGKVTITRASHVEPHPEKPGWLADMRPSGGPILGLGDSYLPIWKSGEFDPEQPMDRFGSLQQQFLPGPFATRAEALDAERQWLRDHKGL